MKRKPFDGKKEGEDGDGVQLRYKSESDVAIHPERAGYSLMPRNMISLLVKLNPKASSGRTRTVAKYTIKR